jgi:hypothetical protein
VTGEADIVTACERFRMSLGDVAAAGKCFLFAKKVHAKRAAIRGQQQPVPTVLWVSEQ